MAQSSKIKPVHDPGRGNGGNRAMTIVVTVLGVGIVVALLFVGVAFVIRLLSGSGNTPTPEATLRPTYTPLAWVTKTPEPVPTTAVAVVVPELTVTATATLTATQPAGTVAPTAPPPTDQPATQAPTATPAPPTATSRPSSSPAKMTSPDYGIQAFLWWQPEIAHRDLGLIRDAGFNWVKQWFAWSDIEGAGKGKYDWTMTDRIVEQAQDFGLKLIVRVDHAPAWAGPPPGNADDFSSFLSVMAKRYQGRVQAYQVWNEPNLAREWGDKPPNAAEYTQMLKKAYQAIKKADPNAIVVSAGLAPTTELSQRAVPDTQFVQAMYNAGAKPYFDMLGVHGAGYKAPPEKDPGEVANDPSFYNVGDPNCPGPACRIYCFRHVEDLRQIMVDNGDANKRVVVLEFGWTIDERPNSPYYWHRVNDQFTQGDYMVRAYQYAKAHWQPWIALMSLIYMPDVKWTQNDEQYWWSVMDPSPIDQLNLKAPYVMLCLYIRQERGMERCPYAP
jgi:Na+-transporting methylmalonyl-CoA/oxaloacetate decarboxylase gamma subunit